MDPSPNERRTLNPTPLLQFVPHILPHLGHPLTNRMSPYGGWLLVIGCWWLVSGDLETDTPRVRLGVSLAALQTPSAAPSHQQPATSNQPPATQPQYNGTSVRLLTLLLLTPLLPAQDRS